MRKVVVFVYLVKNKEGMQENGRRAQIESKGSMREAIQCYEERKAT